MTYRRTTTSQINRIGVMATVLKRSESGSDQFNNTEYTWIADRQIPCIRSYPNRNVEEDRSSGSLESDRPVLIFPRANGPQREPDATDQPAPPANNDRVLYKSTRYSLVSRTEYDTHIEIMANRVDN
jgi:hypothetical protein